MKTGGLYQQRGMTLLELLIATAVLAIMAGMGFFGVSVLMEASNRIDEKEKQWRIETMQMMQVSRDVASAISSNQPLSVSENIDFVGDGMRFELIRFSQQLMPGAQSAAAHLNDVIQVAWYLKNGTLFRAQRPVVQRHNTQAWQEQPMLNVKFWNCQYLTITGRWVPSWPNESSQNSRLPKQVKCRLTSQDNRESEWLLTPWQNT